LTRLTKRDGTKEESQRRRFEDSLRRLGVSTSVINSTPQRVKPTNDDSTPSFRNRIIIELQSRSPETARRYENSRRLKANGSEQVAAGTARVNPTTLRHHGWKPGETVIAQHGGASTAVRVEESTQVGMRAVQFNPRTLCSLGVSEGTKVSLTRNQ
jgi:hypothetical protein